MARKFPNSFKVEYNQFNGAWALTGSDGWPGATGTAPNRTIAHMLAWDAAEEMGLVTDGE
jgi:hypothetical protein